MHCCEPGVSVVVAVNASAGRGADLGALGTATRIPHNPHPAAHANSVPVCPVLHSKRTRLRAGLCPSDGENPCWWSTTESANARSSPVQVDRPSDADLHRASQQAAPVANSRLANPSAIGTS